MTWGSTCNQLKLLLCLVPAFLFSSLLSAQNPIVTENALQGSPYSEWGVPNFRDNRIAGFATKMSLNAGETVRFKINVQSGATYTMRIYRLGYYNGNGARLKHNFGTLQGTAQPAGLSDPVTGLLDCSNWSVSATWNIPSNAVSGLYFAKVERTGGGSNHIVFIVRNDNSQSDLYLQFPDARWQAYNGYGGNSAYDGTTGYPGGHAVKVSYNRPFFIYNSAFNTDGRGADWYMNNEYPMIRFLERNGYDVTYTSSNDVATNGQRLLNHKVFIAIGHDEYWSKEQRNNVEAARNAGVHLAFFTGNEVYWKTRWETSVDGEHRTLVCYKEGLLGDGTQGERTCGGKCDGSSPEWTGLWRTGANYDAGKPENALVGQISWVEYPAEIGVPAFYKKLRFWRNTSVASLADGQTAFLGYETLGYEWDYEQYEGSYPPGRITMSSRTINSLTHKLSLYRHSSGALVFGAGTVQWSWGLDGNHWGGSTTVSTEMQQATINLFADMNVQPATLMPGMVSVTASTDAIAPTATITSPANGTTFPSGSTLNFTGTAIDAGGGVVAGVEVSVDAGNTWRQATLNKIDGNVTWSYSWISTGNGTFNIRFRSFDDSGNMETAGPGINVNVGGPDTTPPVVSSVSPLNGATGISVGTTVIANFSETINPSTVTASSFQLKAGSTVINATLNIATNQVTLVPLSVLATSTNYTVTIKGGSTGVKDVAGNPLATDYTWSFTTGAGGGGGSTTIFQPTDIPQDPNSNDGTPITLGVRFRSTQNGFITGLRYYKSTGATGTHTGHLWTNSGTQLAQLTFFNETASGWQEAYFNTPVAITAGVTYVAGYYSPSGDYSATKPYFTQAVVNGPLRALADGEDGPNGLYQYAPTAVFPSNTFQSSNYWIDVVFTTSAGPDETPPTVISVNPLNAATGVSASTTVVANFSEAIDPSTVTATTFQLRGPGNTLVTATVSASANQITLTPSAALAGSTNYTATITGGASGVKDLAGNALASNYVWSFTTASADVIAPTVTSVSPTSGATGISTGTTVVANFSESVNPSTVTGTTFQLRGPGNTLVSASVSAAAGQITLIPSASLAASTLYTATITGGASGVKDLAGNALASNFIWSFTTAAGGTGGCPCTVFQPSNTPDDIANDGSGISLGMKFRSTQNGFVTGLRYYKGAGSTGTRVGSLWSSTGTLLGQVNFTNETASGWQQAALSSPAAITAGVTYVVSYFSPSGDYVATDPYFTQAVVNGPLRGLANGEDGPNGLYLYSATASFPSNSFNASNYWADVVFTPGAGGDETPPTVTSVSPQSGATGISIGTTVIANFSEAINPSTVTGTTFQLRGPGNTLVTATVSASANQITLTPSASLAGSTTYTATITGGASGVKDNAGNALASNFVWSFTTAAVDVIAPTVTSVTPTSGATGISTGTTVVANFSEAINPSTVTGTTFQLRGPGNTLVTATVSASANQITLTPSASLAGSTTYTATITGGASGVKDNAGNALASNFVWSFTTASTDLIPPTVVSVAPLNAATGVNASTTVVANFSEAINPSTVTGTTFQLRGPGNTLVTATVSASANQITLTPSAALAGSTNYTATITGGASGVKDLAGNALASNYVWSFTTASADVIAPTVTSVSPTSGATGISTGTTVVANFSESVNPSTVTGTTFQLRGPGNTLVSASVSAAANQITLIPSTALAVSTMYTATITGGASGVKDLAGNALASNFVWSFTTEGGGGGTALHILPQEAVPSSPRSNDGVGIALGVRFRSSQNGMITGVRYYKGAGTTGTHTGQLWTNTGTLLAQATFINETASGWQTALFSTPVQITAGVNYVASYHSPSGDFAATVNYYTQAVVNGPLRGLANGESGPNGLYRYSATAVFPNNGYQSSNYWADVVFVPAVAGTAPVVTLQPNSQSMCNDSQVSFISTASGTPTPTVQWQESSNGNTWTNITGATTGTLSLTATAALNNRQYRAVWTNTAGSVNSNPAILTVNAIPAAPTVTVVNNCGSSVLTASGYTGTLLWSNGATTSSITVTAAGTYTVTQTVNGCTSANGTGVAAPNTSVVPTPVVTVVDSCGSSVLSASGYTGSLLWSTGAVTASITVTTSGSYSVTQTVNGCSSAAGIATAAPKAIPVAPTVTVTDNCTNSVLTASNFSGSLLWSNGATTPSINVTTPGTYTVTQTVNGCTSSEGSGIATPKPIPSAPSVEVVNNCGNSVLTASNFTGSLLWSNGATTSSITVTTAGTYTVTQTVNGCTSVSGSGVAAPLNSSVTTPVVTVQDSCGYSILTASEYTGSLLWSTGDTTWQITVLAAGTYTVTQTINGCASAPAISLANPKTIPAAPAVSVVDNCGNSVLTANGFTGSLLWSNGATTSSIAVTAAGTYTVTQIVNGCTSNAGAGVAQPNPASVPTPSVDVVNNCGNSLLTASNFTGTLLWSTGATTTSIIVNNPGVYTVTQTINGCNSAAGSATAAPKPVPQLSGSLAETVNSGTLFNYTPQSATVGTTFTWSRAAVAGISNSAANGTGIISETLINTGTTPVNVTYVYTMTAGDCVNTQDVVVTVLPILDITCTMNGSITTNFNNTPIPAGRYIWFNSVLDRGSFTGITGDVTFYITNSRISFTANNQQYTLNVPDAQVKYESLVLSATTQFVNNTWVTTVPRGYTNYVFMTGLAYQVPVNFPGNISNITWTADIGVNKTGVAISWKWAAAVYTSFGDHSALQIKPLGGLLQNPYLNNDKAGAPQNFKTFLVSGAKGTGGTNYTGSYSGTSNIECTPVSNLRSPEIAQPLLTRQLPVSLAETFRAGSLDVNVMPNPARDLFNIVIRGNPREPVSVRVFDIFGQLLERHDKLFPGQLTRMGQKWRNGTYIVEVIQGNERKVVKVIKAD